MDIASFSVSQFYGRSRKQREICSLEKSEKEQKKLPSLFQHRITGPTRCWKIFYRQREAFVWAQKKARDVLVFAFEKSDGDAAVGKRCYIVTSLPEFWHYYKQLNPSKRHHYEIIPEGCPCKLYFDLEFLKEFNPESNGDRMVELLIEYVCAWLKSSFSISCDRSAVLDLDASTETKFSRHLIFHMPDAVFEHCVSAGNFVRHIFSLFSRYIKLKSGRQVFLPEYHSYDVVVNNRCHNARNQPQAISRVKSPLTMDIPDFDEAVDEQELSLLAEECEQALLPRKSHISFEDSEAGATEQVEAGAVEEMTVSNEGQAHADLGSPRSEMMRICGQFSLDELKTLLVINKDGNQTLFCDLGVYTKNRNFRLYLSSKLNKSNPLVLSTQNRFRPDGASSELTEEDVFYASLVSHTRSEAHIRVLEFGTREEAESHRVKAAFSETHDVFKNRLVRVSADSLEGHSCLSPFPEVDSFIESLVTSHGCNGQIRRWTYFKSSSTLVYDIAGCRWCGNVKREHRSNNIMYVVELQRGVFYQKCHDPDCQAVGYKSVVKDVPYHLLPSSFFEADFDSGDEGHDVDDSKDDDDHLLLAAAEDMELELGHLKEDQYILDEVTYGFGEDDDAMVKAAEQAEIWFHADMKQM